MNFDVWFKERYVKRGFVSSEAELREAWDAAVQASANLVKANTDHRFVGTLPTLILSLSSRDAASSEEKP